MERLRLSQCIVRLATQSHAIPFVLGMFVWFSVLDSSPTRPPTDRFACSPIVALMKILNAQRETSSESHAFLKNIIYSHGIEHLEQFCH